MPKTILRSPALNSFEIRQKLSISQERMSNLLGVSVKTVSRWEKEKRQPSKPQQLLGLAKLKEIIDLGLAVYTSEGLKEFLRTPLPVFEGRTGFELIQLGEYDRVIGALAADFEGTGF